MAILEPGPHRTHRSPAAREGCAEPQGELGSASDDPGVLAGTGLGGHERNRGAPGAGWRVIGVWNQWNQWRAKGRLR